MNPILVVALICANSVQAPDCTRDTAVDIVTAPAHTLQECLIQGPTIAVNARRGNEANTYVKTRCEQRR